jgi:hypothetical protein
LWVIENITEYKYTFYKFIIFYFNYSGFTNLEKKYLIRGKRGKRKRIPRGENDLFSMRVL